MTAAFVRCSPSRRALDIFHADHRRAGACHCPTVRIIRLDSEPGQTVTEAVTGAFRLSGQVGEAVLLVHLEREVIVNVADDNSVLAPVSRWHDWPTPVAEVGSAAIEAKRTHVGHASTILDPAPSTRTEDTAAIIGALDGCIDLINALRTSLGATGSTTGPHAVLLHEVRMARARISNRITESP